MCLSKVLLTLAALPIGLTSVGVSLVAADWSSTNIDRVQRFWTTADAAQRPVTIVAFGDSLQNVLQSLPRELFPRLAAKLGQAGRSFDGEYPGVSAPVPADGTTVIPPDSKWFLDHYELPPGGSLSWQNYTGLPGFSLPADTVGVHYLSWPGGGQFAMRVSTNGGPWTTLALINSAEPVLRGSFAQFPVPFDNYRLRIEGITGTNLILWQELVAAQSSGIKTAWLQRNGLNMNTVFAVPTNVLYQVLSNLQPDLLIWHMKDLADLGEPALKDRLTDLGRWWRQATPNADAIYVGTPYEQRDLESNFTETQNGAVRTAAIRDQQCYLDCMTPMVSYDWMTNHGYLSDPVHPSIACYQKMADIFWRELNLDALRTDRKIQVQLTGNDLLLEYTTLTNFYYRLRSSTDLVTWSTVQSNRGDGARQTFTNSIGAPTRFYRLELIAE